MLIDQPPVAITFRDNVQNKQSKRDGMDKIILASGSKTRKALLMSAGVNFESQPGKH